MTTALAEHVDGSAFGGGGRRRNVLRRALIVAAVALTALLLAAGLGFWRYAATYAPLKDVGFYGPYDGSVNVLVTRPTDLGNEMFIRGPAGTEARFIFGIRNDGAFDVTIDSVARTLIRRTQWSPYVSVPGGNVEGKALPLRALPATVPAHSAIRVVLTFQKPPCQPGLLANVGGAAIFWQSLGVHHGTDFPLGLGRTTFVGCPHYIH